MNSRGQEKGPSGSADGEKLRVSRGAYATTEKKDSVCAITVELRWPISTERTHK